MSVPESIATSTADLFDADPSGVAVCALPFIDYGGRARFRGPCSTLVASDDPSAIAQAVSEPGEGRVLVIDGLAVADCACLGDMLGRRAVDNGWAGVVVAGLVRDSAALAALPLGVRALGTTARRPFGRDGGATRDVSVNLGGVTFEPGLTVVADEDAVIVLRRS
ncbi:MAG: ribonuclease E activity regulator RraA [Sphingomonas adhaesiva]|uniref:ribonuclease E activity regulator RraA n=1 Tax=Sphingomonas adhaesiva TaxID=28212 RepID=UPI002FF569D8